MRTFQSAREALAFANAFDHRQQIRGSLGSGGGRGGRPDEQAAVNVAVCLRRAGVERGSELEAAMLEWATTPSRVGSSADAKAEQSENDAELQHERRLASWAKWRGAVAAFAAELEHAGLLETAPPQPAPGYRVHQLRDAVFVTVVANPDPRDASIFSSREQVDQALAAGRATKALPATQREAVLEQARELAEQGAALGTIDALLKSRLGVADSTAREIRRKLGIKGDRGRPRKSQPQVIACG